MVIEQGAQSDDVFVVYSGQLLGLLLSHTGREITFSEIRPGHYFGELSALDGLPRSITISAVTAARLGVMSAPLFRLWMAREPRIALNVARELAEAVWKLLSMCRLRRFRRAAVVLSLSRECDEAGSLGQLGIAAISARMPISEIIRLML